MTVPPGALGVIPNGRLPRLRLCARPDGTLEAVGHIRASPIEPVDDGWWRDVLHDPRAQVPTDSRLPADGPRAYYRLDRYPYPEIALHCRCGQSKVLNRDDLIARLGGDMNVMRLAREAIDCGNRNKVTNYCQARLVRA